MDRLKGVFAFLATVVLGVVLGCAMSVAGGMEAEPDKPRNARVLPK